ncbi:hypothetical protein F7731_02770 [Cytobacillus depressus]|uniref:Competence protein ComGF n=2 Tax=Cytobacillus depressus TaxID=1602942 RepID=A0A6L3VBC4_9BACI|nr:hypothetical protein F7731_02770 [Cytobacillus depressus]
MLEMLYAFSIFLLIISFFPLTLKYFLDNEQFELRTKRMEWHVFVNQLKKELRLSEELDVYDQRIILKKHGQNIIYERYGANLRRRVDSKGHEIVFQQVDTFQFSRIPDGVKLTLRDLYNQTYSISIYSYINLENDYASQ